MPVSFGILLLVQALPIDPDKKSSLPASSNVYPELVIRNLR